VERVEVELAARVLLVAEDTQQQPPVPEMVVEAVDPVLPVMAHLVQTLAEAEAEHTVISV
jgi:hypothetical protein